MSSFNLRPAKVKLQMICFLCRFGEWIDKKGGKAFEPRLFQVSDESGKMIVEEIAEYDQEVFSLSQLTVFWLFNSELDLQSLDGDDVMILDALNTIYVWVGAKANENEKKNALETAKVGLETGYHQRCVNVYIHICGVCLCVRDSFRVSQRFKKRQHYKLSGALIANS